MSYLVLARKYRSQTFDQVVDQGHVTKTLSNAVKTGRVAHAILFTGPRGTGKTTIARILAKILNCSGNKDGATPYIPCNECSSCKEITSGNASDVFEIDGASNNSVDQIRELRENARYKPAHSPYKIYIIDEVHMLSVAAFNALLKILEEPPAHVKFLFATTEAHKIPITILSRCQRHDLRRIDVGAISNHMASLCEQENIKISQESLGLIAQESDGSMRDALSLLDQILSCAEDSSVPHEQVLGILGVIDRKIIFETSQALLSSNITEVLHIIEEIYARGQNIKKFYSSILEHFRNLLIVKLGLSPDKLVDVPAHELDHMANQVNGVPELFINQILNTLFQEESSIRYGANPRLALEMIFIRIFQTRPAISMDALIGKIDLLRNEIHKTGAIPVKTVVQAPPLPQPNRTEQKPVVENTPPPNNQVGQIPATVAPQPGGTPAVTNSTPQENQPQSQMHEPTLSNHGQPEHDYGAGSDLAPYNATDAKAESWSKLLAFITRKHPAIAATLSKCRLKSLSPQKIELESDGNSFIIGRLHKEKNMSVMKKAALDFFGTEPNIVITSIQVEKQTTKEVKPTGEKQDIIRQNAIRHPLISDVVDILGGNIVDIKLINKDKIKD